MEKFTTLCSKVAPLPLNDIDTDMIIPARYLTGTGKDGYGPHLFEGLKETYPNFVIDDIEFQDARILAAGKNFGCGSSREHAVWALCERGFRVIIAPSFADIFASNSAKNGLLLISLDKAEVSAIIESASKCNYRCRIDLAAQRIEDSNGNSYSFNCDPFRKHCLLNGLDDFDYILSHLSEIEEFEKKAR